MVMSKKDTLIFLDRLRMAIEDGDTEALEVLLDWVGEHYPQHLAISVLVEFIRDIEAAGTKDTENDWPDLYETYKRAKEVLSRKTPMAAPDAGLGYSDYKDALSGEGWAINDYKDMEARAKTEPERKVLRHIREEEEEHFDELIKQMDKLGIEVPKEFSAPSRKGTRAALKAWATMRKKSSKGDICLDCGKPISVRLRHCSQCKAPLCVDCWTKNNQRCKVCRFDRPQTPMFAPIDIKVGDLVKVLHPNTGRLDYGVIIHIGEIEVRGRKVGYPDSYWAIWEIESHHIGATDAKTEAVSQYFKFRHLYVPEQHDNLKRPGGGVSRDSSLYHPKAIYGPNDVFQATISAYESKNFGEGYCVQTVVRRDVDKEKPLTPMFAPVSAEDLRTKWLSKLRNWITSPPSRKYVFADEVRFNKIVKELLDEGWKESLAFPQAYYTMTGDGKYFEIVAVYEGETIYSKICDTEREARDMWPDAMSVMWTKPKATDAFVEVRECNYDGFKEVMTWWPDDIWTDDRPKTPMLAPGPTNPLDFIGGVR